MDLENFEFRPLTDGLGFDKTTEEARKAQSISRPQKPAKPEVAKKTFELPNTEFVTEPKAPVSRSLKKMLDSLPPSVDFKQDSDRDLKVKVPVTPEKAPALPVYQPKTEVAPSTVVAREDFDITLDNSLSQAFPKEEVNKRFYHQTVEPIPKFKEIEASFASAVIDFLIVLGLSSLFIVSLIFFTGVDIFSMLASSELSARVTTEIALLYVGVALVYFMLSRGMFGSTLGDWAFDVQLGSEDERRHLMYPFQVLFRTLVIFATGIITVPLVSLGFGKDIAFYFSGLKLYSRQY